MVNELIILLGWTQAMKNGPQETRKRRNRNKMRQQIGGKEKQGRIKEEAKIKRSLSYPKFIERSHKRLIRAT